MARGSLGRLLGSAGGRHRRDQVGRDTSTEVATPEASPQQEEWGCPGLPGLPRTAGTGPGLPHRDQARGATGNGRRDAHQPHHPGAVWYQQAEPSRGWGGGRMGGAWGVGGSRRRRVPASSLLCTPMWGSDRGQRLPRGAARRGVWRPRPHLLLRLQVSVDDPQAMEVVQSQGQLSQVELDILLGEHHLGRQNTVAGLTLRLVCSKELSLPDDIRVTRQGTPLGSALRKVSGSLTLPCGSDRGHRSSLQSGDQGRQKSRSLQRWLD